MMRALRLLLAGAVLAGETRAQAPSDSGRDPLAALTWRSIGPLHDGGRVADIAVPRIPQAAGVRSGTVFYAASGTGGLFKTTNGGTSWSPLFDREAAAAIHSVAVSPADPQLIWVGTGDPIALHFLTPGRGVYKSTDGGAHWASAGLRDAVVIWRIVPHPTNTAVAYAAAGGSLADSGGTRGVYKTGDGGRTWKRVLYVNGWTGAVDLALDPAHPEVLFAATQQQAQSPALLVGYGPGSGLFKSTDAGATWRRLVAGLPTGYLGNIGVAVSPANPAVVYAAVSLATKHDTWGYSDVAVFRSHDAGEHWVKAHDLHGNGYPVRVVADPRDEARLFVTLSDLVELDHGGDSVVRLPYLTDAGGDLHAVWIDPDHPDHWITGHDVGVSITEDGGRSWSHVGSLAVGQFRHIDADRRTPFYYVYGESQDHAGVAGPSRTRGVLGITPGDWFSTSAPEGGYVAADPTDSSTLYTWSMGVTTLSRFNVDTREARILVPEPERWGPHFGEGFAWDNPIAVSPHDARTVYAGITRLWRSTDRGERWETMPGLVAHPGRDSLTLMALPDVRLRGRHDSFTAIAESPLARGVLYVGTRAGLLHVSRDGGRTWATRDTFPGIAKGLMVSRVTPSRFDTARVYLTIVGADAGDFRPHVLESRDYGAHWVARDATLPADAMTWVVAEHFRTPDLWFVGTDAGVFFTTDGGARWRPLRGNMPAVRVRDLLVQPQANDLVIGTYGRGIWILDDVTPLERLAAAERGAGLTLFPIRDAILTHVEGEEDYSLSGPPNAPQVAANPDPAIFTYFVPAGAARDSVTLTVLDSSGATLRTLRASGSRGLHRAGWDLLLGPDVWFPRTWSALPGRYSVRLAVGGASSEQPLRIRSDPLTALTGPRLDSIAAIRRRAAALRDRLLATAATAETLKAEVDSAGARIARVRRAPQLERAARGLSAALDSVLAMHVDPLAEHRPDALENLVDQVLHAVSRLITGPEVPGLRVVLDSAEARLVPYERRLRDLKDARVPAFRGALQRAGVAGRSRP